MADEVKRTFDLADADYERAIGILVLHQKASTSYLQRTMRLGYNAAASLMERAEKEGFVSRAVNTGKRDVLISLPELVRLRASQADAGARVLAVVRQAHETLVEINPNNYTHDEVVEANDAAVESIFLLADLIGETHGKSSEWWKQRRAALAEQERADG